MSSRMFRTLVSLAVFVLAGNALAEEPTPGFNTKIPEWVLTPDTVETKLGTLQFFDGIPDEKAAECQSGPQSRSASHPERNASL